MRLQHKFAVITGAGSGIGLAMATRFAAEGAKIVAGDWNPQRLDEAVASTSRRAERLLARRGILQTRTPPSSPFFRL
jgi:NAD(P)-dependent dehydrogenase (short-subunit alcohol dehydrogenase family)